MVLGSLYDGSPYENFNEFENITKILESTDFENFGNETMYNGFTGEQFMSSILWMSVLSKIKAYGS